MKSLMLVLLLVGVALGAENFELRAPHNVILHSGQQGADLQFSSMPDDVNFQASGGAALTSFGGLARVVVLLVVLLGVLYHGFIPTVVASSNIVRPAPAALSLPKIADSPRDDSLPIEVFGPSAVAEPHKVVAAEPKPDTVHIRSEGHSHKSKQGAKKRKVSKRPKDEETKPAPVLASQPVEPVTVAETVQIVELESIPEEKNEVVAPSQPEIAPVQEEEVCPVPVEAVTEQPAVFAAEPAVEAEPVVEAPAPVAQEVFEEALPESPAADETWVCSSPRAYEPTSAIIQRAKRMLLTQELLANRRTRKEIVPNLDAELNCPVTMNATPLDLDLTFEDEVPPISPPVVSPTATAPIMIPPAELRDWAFNSHKKASWMQKQRHAVKYPTLPPIPQPDLMPFGWSPIRTPCKFAAGCKKPGCQFTHPWTPPPATPALGPRLATPLLG